MQISNGSLFCMSLSMDSSLFGAKILLINTCLVYQCSCSLRVNTESVWPQCWQPLNVTLQPISCIPQAEQQQLTYKPHSKLTSREQKSQDTKQFPANQVAGMVQSLCAQEICRSLDLDLRGQTSASYNMRLNYEKCLLEFEKYLAFGRYSADLAEGTAPPTHHLEAPAAIKPTQGHHFIAVSPKTLTHPTTPCNSSSPTMSPPSPLEPHKSPCRGAVLKPS